MADLLPCNLNISKGISTESPYTRRGGRLNHGRKISGQKGSVLSNKGCVVQCCSASSTSASSAAKQFLVNDRTSFQDREEQLENLVSEHGWRARRLANDGYEMKEVAQIQAEAFHTPVAIFDDLFFQFFKAEVLSGLLYKLRNSPPDRYACLVAEPAADSSKSQREKLVGIVDVTASRDESVMQHLRGAEEYLYVSGIAVSKTFRRQKIGSVLLKACDVLSTLWGFKYLVLRAFEDDVGARRLYTKAGYKVVSIDPQWMTWIGRKRRVLMIKQSNLLD
ncbi:hypothetical protein P3X46_008370 [Hevea brasiliensis]|uniref:N-acetyltransferase domain-containing protein n=1 Tax=Hevea brasiliensis TaxID=3981 RepID=A0ABQ9MMF9_HEVBR|nr:GCN5-related N-acetyltransferase 10, chloroplastic [Hevea brasiliensis]KAJ9180084.1 hypothetical protein P3X46_008370 [Hevea brasiliensis]